MATFTTKNSSTIEGPIIVKPTTLEQGREWLFDTEQQEQYAAMGIEETFAFHFSETLARGVMRGLHFQRKDSYGKFVAVTAGRILSVVVDLRPESKTFGAAASVELSASNETMIYVPPYFAHGYLTLEGGSEVIINTAAPIDPTLESGIIYDDEILAIDWQFERYDIDERRLNISPRDKKLPSFRSYNQNSLWINRPKKSRYALARR